MNLKELKKAKEMLEIFHVSGYDFYVNPYNVDVEEEFVFFTFSPMCKVVYSIAACANDNRLHVAYTGNYLKEPEELLGVFSNAQEAVEKVKGDFRENN